MDVATTVKDGTAALAGAPGSRSFGDATAVSTTIGAAADMARSIEAVAGARSATGAGRAWGIAVSGIGAATATATGRTRGADGGGGEGRATTDARLAGTTTFREGIEDRRGGLAAGPLAWSTVETSASPWTATGADLIAG